MENEHNEFDALLGDSRTPWNRQFVVGADGKRVYESPKAHSAFRAYAEMGDQRSVQAVATALSKSRTLVQRWSGRWFWKERAKAWDDHIHDQELRGLVAARKQMAERQARAAVLGQNLSIQRIMELQNAIGQGVRTEKLSPMQAARMFEICSKIERVVRGEPREDDLAAIYVTVSLQKQPRYADPEELRREEESKKPN